MPYPVGEAQRHSSRKPRFLASGAARDPVVWDRDRFELLRGWVYRFEAYTTGA